MSPNLARFTSVESTPGRAGSRSGKGARLDERVMAVTRKLNRAFEQAVTAWRVAGRGWRVNTAGRPGVTVVERVSLDLPAFLSHTGPFLSLRLGAFSPSSIPTVCNSLLSSRWRAFIVIGASAAIAMSASAQARRPMTFLDVQNMRQVGAPDLSTDG